MAKEAGTFAMENLVSHRDELFFGHRAGDLFLYRRRLGDDQRYPELGEAHEGKHYEKAVTEDFPQFYYIFISVHLFLLMIP
jgi:hypothetical protein